MSREDSGIQVDRTPQEDQAQNKKSASLANWKGMFSEAGRYNRVDYASAYRGLFDLHFMTVCSSMLLANVNKYMFWGYLEKFHIYFTQLVCLLIICLIKILVEL